jgi:large repetitive protein
MAINFRPVVLGSAAFLLNCGEPQPSTNGGPAVHVGPTTPVTSAIRLGVTPFAVDEAGVPRLFRGGATTPAMPAADATTSARMHVERLAPAWGVAEAGMPALEAAGEVPVAVGTVVRLRQVIDGIPVDAAGGGEVRVMVGKGGELLAASGKLIGSDLPRDKTVRYVDDEAGAVARAVGDLYKTTVAPTALATKAIGSDGSLMLASQGGDVNVSLSRARKAWYPEGGKLTAAWIVEAYSSAGNTTDGDAYRTVLAADGRVIARTNLKEDVAFRYRVHAEATGELRPFDGPIEDVSPHPTGVPGIDFPRNVGPNLVSVEGLNRNPQGRPDPWLAANRTETIGNNVEAYTDISAPDGLTFGDFRATLTSALTFDRTFDPTKGAIDSQGQQMAGIASLFYTINFLHDYWYDAGFNEAAGNGQNLNFNRGGEDRDAINAEAQDNANGGSRNNANMSTPADGFPPRMQVFLWDGKEDRSLGVSRRKPATGTAAFGAKNFDVNAELVLAEDGSTAGGGTPSDGCQPLTAPATGKIVLADRGGCTFKTKALVAQNAGALALILANNVAAAAPPGLADDPLITVAINIGTLSVLQTEGAALKAELAAGPVRAQMHRKVEPDLEGTLDATVVAHEFGHYFHHRLSQCNTALCGGQSEGWGDFLALMLMVRAGDNFDGAYPVGAYSTQSQLTDATYFGIRRAPYSTRPEINSLSFRHMGNGTALPTNHPFLVNGNANAQVHNTGEVWASMLWQGYSALLKQPGAVFETVRANMKKYIVGGLLLAPTDATPTETRDAILTFTHALSPADHDVLAAAYATRGFGSCAISPARNSTTNAGIVESFEVKGRLEPGSPTLQSVARCDNDNVLDAGESARITVSIANPGPASLADVNVTLASTTPGITITRPTLAVGALNAYGSTTATFNIRLDDEVTAATAGEFAVTVATSNGCNATVTVPLVIALHTDDVPASSATDTFDAGATVWTPADDIVQWSHARKSALDGIFTGADSSAPSDSSLVSPALTAGAGPLTISFTHRHQFEFAGTTAFDGGVFEFTTNNGATWQDISVLANPGYNTTLTGTPDTTLNVLAGRPAFGNRNPAFPATNTVTLDLGNALAGQTFRIRFRIGTDANTGAPGWEIDNVVFNGIVGTPFPTLVADPGHCNTVAPSPSPEPQSGDGQDPVEGEDPGREGPIDEGGCQAGGSGAGAGFALGLLAVLLGRRRR